MRRDGQRAQAADDVVQLARADAQLEPLDAPGKGSEERLPLQAR